jgi:LPXTG-site transpeptidase (sortase) family protein
VAQAAQRQLDSKPAPAKLSGVPNRIVVPSLAIDLPVVSQTYSKALKSWPVAPSDANYATETPLINNSKGQSLIYGHDNRAVFGPLLNMQPRTEVYVYTANGHIFKYSFTGFKDVSPNQVNIVSEMTDAPVGLNLITCTGAYFQYRHLMSLKFVQAT